MIFDIPNKYLNSIGSSYSLSCHIQSHSRSSHVQSHTDVLLKSSDIYYDLRCSVHQFPTKYLNSIGIHAIKLFLIMSEKNN